MGAYDSISAAIKAAADLADGLQKLVLGSPGSTMVYPDIDGPEGDATREVRATGQLWDGLVFPLILQKLGLELDRASSAWASVSTNATGVVPSIVAGSHITNAAKNEGGNSLTLTIDPPFLNADYAVSAMLIGTIAVPKVTSRLANSISVLFEDTASGVLGINDRTITVQLCGVV